MKERRQQKLSQWNVLGFHKRKLCLSSAFATRLQDENEKKTEN